MRKLRFPTESTLASRGRRLASLVCLAAVVGTSACLFGPKHEDPGDDQTAADAGLDVPMGLGDTAMPGDTLVAIPDGSSADTGSVDRNCDADVGEAGCGDAGGGGEVGDADAAKDGVVDDVAPVDAVAVDSVAEGG